jgi:hypothetical protein
LPFIAEGGAEEILVYEQLIEPATKLVSARKASEVRRLFFIFTAPEFILLTVQDAGRYHWFQIITDAVLNNSDNFLKAAKRRSLKPRSGERNLAWHASAKESC